MSYWRLNCSHASAKAPQHFPRLYHQESYQGLMLKIQEISAGGSRGGERVAIVKYSQSLLYNNGLFPRGKSLSESCLRGVEEGHSSHSCPLQPSCSASERGQLHKKKTSESHRPVTIVKRDRFNWKTTEFFSLRQLTPAPTTLQYNSELQRNKL